MHGIEFYYLIFSFFLYQEVLSSKLLRIIDEFYGVETIGKKDQKMIVYLN